MREAKRWIDSDEFTEWMAYWRLEPFGDEWRQVGTIAAASVQPHCKPGRQITPDDYMPVPKRLKRQSAQEIETFLRAMCPPSKS